MNPAWIYRQPSQPPRLSASPHPDFKNVVLVVLIFAAAYATCYFLFGSPFAVPEGNMFALVLVWALGHIGGFIAVQASARSPCAFARMHALPRAASSAPCGQLSPMHAPVPPGVLPYPLLIQPSSLLPSLTTQCRIPALLGMLIIGAVFENLPREILRAYKHSWVSAIKAFGLATILMRAGLKINYVKVTTPRGRTAGARRGVSQSIRVQQSRGTHPVRQVDTSDPTGKCYLLLAIAGVQRLPLDRAAPWRRPRAG